ncbi:MAG: substrate-binding domain-containing protein [Melioribacteraceae bacterium]|nr:substrate-binding domain-containing protein [Melioribacteraceae bacterium]MCF8264771.1 substrate-binding domain-containing protein [Melioribacteraceae bacterium]MCF8432210.1 substrate-binding domain-containing protein [Melioribacteraceae bacterium]
MKKISLLLSIIIFCSCSSLFETEPSEKEFLIGFSQCTSEDLWRQTMNDEINREIFFYENLSLVMTDADNSIEKQIADIRSLVEQKVDLLIVSPVVSGPLTSIIDEVYKMGIPVILLDRKIEGDSYTAFIGADNHEIGYQAGIKAAQLLEGKGRILEFWGLNESSPAKGRHEGFADALNNYKKIEIVDSGPGNWYPDSAAILAKKMFEKDKNFDLIYSHNDAMAKEVYKVANSMNVDIEYYIGVDALPGNEGGIQMVIDGILDATFVYPTFGSQAIQTAEKILKGISWKKDNLSNSIAVLPSTAKMLKHQTDQLLADHKKIERQREILNKQIVRIESQRDALYILGFASMIILLGIFFAVRAYFVHKKLNLKLNKNNEELRFLNAKLAESEASLIELNATKDKLFSIISHDLKNPFNIILNASKELAEEYSTFSEDERVEYIGMIKEEAVNSYVLLENLLHWSRAQRGALTVSKDVQNLEKLIQKGIINCVQPATNKNIKIEIEIDEKLNVFVDDTMLITVVRNLVANAVKFTMQGGTIKVSSRILDEKFIEVSIKDNGVGMEQDKLDRLFLVNEQITSPGTENEPGTGLGLIICKEFVEKNGGEILVESESGEGTTFYITLTRN